MKPALYICGQDLPPVTRRAMVAPYMGWAALAAIDRPNMPWPTERLTQKQVSRMCDAMIPAAYAGPVLWNAHEPMVWQPKMTPWFADLLAKAAIAHPAAQHVLYTFTSDNFPPAEYAGWWENNKPDRRAIELWNFSRLSMSLQFGMGAYIPGWNTDWDEAQNVSNIERRSRDAASLVLQSSVADGKPAIVVVNGRIFDSVHGFRASAAAIRAMVRGALEARSLDGARSIDTLMYWTAETEFLKLELGGTHQDHIAAANAWDTEVLKLINSEMEVMYGTGSVSRPGSTRA